LVVGFNGGDTRALFTGGEMGLLVREFEYDIILDA